MDLPKKFYNIKSRLFLPFAFCLLPFAFLCAFTVVSAQSGRQTLPPQQQQQNSKPPQAKPAPPPVQETRPRRATTEAAQDDQDPAIKLSADLVTAITSVTDPAGNQINNLTKDDFAIYEDNQAQDLEGVYREGQLPLRMVFLFDTSTSIRTRLEFERRAAAQFFRQVLRADDKAAVISVSNDPVLEVPFTSDIEKLIGGLDRLKAEGATALYAAMAEGAKLLSKQEGRRVMIVLSDGTDTVSGVSLAQALKEVQQADIVIYGVHSTGVAPSLNVQDLGGEFVLKAMSEDTGGKAYFPPIYDDPKKEAKDLDEIYRRIAADVRAQYVLTYYSKNDERTKSFRAIRVEVKRPGLQVRARRGYYTTK